MEENIVENPVIDDKYTDKEMRKRLRGPFWLAILSAIMIIVCIVGVVVSFRRGLLKQYNKLNNSVISNNYYTVDFGNEDNEWDILPFSVATYGDGNLKASYIDDDDVLLLIKKVEDEYKIKNAASFDEKSKLIPVFRIGTITVEKGKVDEKDIEKTLNEEGYLDIYSGNSGNVNEENKTKIRDFEEIDLDMDDDVGVEWKAYYAEYGDEDKPTYTLVTTATYENKTVIVTLYGLVDEDDIEDNLEQILESVSISNVDKEV